MKYSLSFEEKDLNVVVNCLAEAPYKVSAPILADIQNQINATVSASQKDEKNKPSDEKEKK